MNHKPLPLSSWQASKIALHCMLQIIGKIRMKLHPKRNHWWHVTLYLTANGLTTGPIPYGSGIFQIDFDFLNHLCIIKTSRNQLISFELANLSVADFYKSLFAKLADLNIKIEIIAKPFDPVRVQTDIPFADNNTHRYQDLKAIKYFWQLLTWIYPIFQKFGGQFSGKTTPVHLYWHSMDYVITRFSGKKAPVIEGMDPVSAEAYSDEVISFGFWMGDSDLPEPAFYSYTYPAPENLMVESLKPAVANWIEVNNNPLALLKYHDLIQLDNVDQGLSDFLESAYQAGAKLVRWSVR